MRAIVTVGVSLLLVGFFAPTGSVASDQPQVERRPISSLGVKVEHGLLSVDVRDAPLADVLRAIGEQTAVEVTIHSGGADLVTESFAGVSLDEGIKRLAQGHDVVLVFAPPLDGTQSGRLAEVRLYRGSTELARTEQRTPSAVARNSKPPGTAGPSTPSATAQASAPATKAGASSEVGAAGGSAPVAIDVDDDPERIARVQAVRDLAEQANDQHPEAVSSLADLLDRDGDPAVRQSAAYSLGKVQATDSMQALASALNDQEPSVRAGVVSSLGRLQNDGVADIVGNVLTRDPDARVRQAAVWALSAFRSEETRRQVEAAMSDPDPGVRHAATQLIGRWDRQTGMN